MIKKLLNQNTKYEQELIKTIEPNFNFSNKPINRLNLSENNNPKEILIKAEKLSNLKQKIYSIENCNLRKASKNLILGNGKVNSQIMFIGEAPGVEEDTSGAAFQGEVGELLKKMLIAININIKDVYLTYSVNYRPPDDRKPTTQEIKRYSSFLKEHISIIDPQIIVLMGSTSMASLMGINNKISDERGKWNEIILNNKTYPVMITFSPSYLIRFPENKKYSWVDLKKIKQKIYNLNIKF